MQRGWHVAIARTSLPSRERELKPVSKYSTSYPASSLPSRERELKRRHQRRASMSRSVAPLAGARIETSPLPASPMLLPSLPSRERELKHHAEPLHQREVVSLPSRERELKPSR